MDPIGCHDGGRLIIGRNHLGISVRLFFSWSCRAHSDNWSPSGFSGVHFARRTAKLSSPASLSFFEVFGQRDKRVVAATFKAHDHLCVKIDLVPGSLAWLPVDASFINTRLLLVLARTKSNLSHSCDSAQTWSLSNGQFPKQRRVVCNVRVTAWTRGSRGTERSIAPACDIARWRRSSEPELLRRSAREWNRLASPLTRPTFQSCLFV